MCKKSKVLSYFFIGVMAFSLVGCGHNLFVNLDKDKTADVVTDADSVKTDAQAEDLISKLNDLLLDSNKTYEYQNLKNAAQKLIDNPLLSDGVKYGAMKIKGEAGMGLLGITPLDVAATLLDATKVSGDIKAEDFIKKLGFDSAVTLESSKDLANTFNDIPVSQLSSSNALQKAVANTVVVIEAIQTVYDSDTGKFVGTPADSLKTLVAEDESGNSILTYATTAVESYDDAGAFDITGNDDQGLKDGVNDFKKSTSEMSSLNRAVSDGTVYNYDGVTYDFRDRTVNHDADIESAFGAILKGGSN